MTLVSLRTRSVAPYVHGYQRVDAVATLALDPGRPANRAIVDLQLARRRGDDRVWFDADVVLLRAPDPKGLLHVVANRGVVGPLPYTVGAPPAEPSGAIAAGDAWTLRRGLSVLWVGWQWDVRRRPGVVGLAAPDAIGPDGTPLRGQVRLGFQALVDARTRRLGSDEGVLSPGTTHVLPGAAGDDPTAVLTEREWFNGAGEVVPRDTWRFVDSEHVELDGGFRSRRHYELIYTTDRCPVAGAGLAAVRDVVSHLRGEFSYTLALGISQSGRWLRQFVHDTGNADEEGGRVFDGIHCHLAGGRRGEFNHRFAQPSTMNPLGFGHLPPFSPDDGLLARARAMGTAPKMVSTNTATEYWRGDASLSHPNPDSDPDCRWYAYAGANHVASRPGYVESLPVQLAPNIVDITYAMRAHAAALEDWVRDNIQPPPSAVPQLHDGSGVRRQAALAKLRSIDDLAHITFPDERALLGLPPLDLGPDVERGIGQFPPTVLGPDRDCLVAAIDADGNERAGVRLPHVEVPLDVSFGWNPEQPREGIPVEVWNLVGGRCDLSRDEVLLRYGSRDDYVSRVRAVAVELVRRRHLLADDVGLIVMDALRRWVILVGLSR